jgi:hypothetical protein
MNEDSADSFASCKHVSSGPTMLSGRAQEFNASFSRCGLAGAYGRFVHMHASVALLEGSLLRPLPD